MFQAISRTFVFCMRYRHKLEELPEVMYPLVEIGKDLASFLETFEMKHGITNLRHEWIRNTYLREFWENDKTWNDAWKESKPLEVIVQCIVGENEPLYDWILCYAAARKNAEMPGEKLVWKGITLHCKNFHLVPLEGRDF